MVTFVRYPRNNWRVASRKEEGKEVGGGESEAWKDERRGEEEKWRLRH